MRQAKQQAREEADGLWNRLARQEAASADAPAGGAAAAVAATIVMAVARRVGLGLGGLDGLRRRRVEGGREGRKGNA